MCVVWFYACIVCAYEKYGHIHMQIPEQDMRQLPLSLSPHCYLETGYLTEIEACHFT